MICRTFRDDLDRDRHHAFLPRLAEARLAPEIIRMDDNELCLRECEKFGEWLDRASETDKLAMRLLLLKLISEVHGLGICHRDLHERNLVLDDGRPMVIDLELACSVDPGAPCFDLYGPSSGVPVAEQHIERSSGDHARHGVWWDSPVEGLGKLFGPLHVAIP